MIHKLSSWGKVGFGFLLLLPFFASCTDDNGLGDDAKGTVRVHGTITTRATTYEVEDKPEVELVSDWWMLVVDASGEIAELVEHDPTVSTPLRNEEFELDLPTGTYDFYTFGNISKEKVESLAGFTAGTLVEGHVFTTTELDALNKAEYNITGDTDADYKFPNGTLQTALTNPIPMSGKQTKTFTKAKEQVELELIRMLAKMKFEFRNASSKKITLHNLTIKPLNEGVIPLLPNYETLTYDNEKDPILLSDATTVKDGKTISFPASTELTANSYADKSETLYFYLRESLAKSHPTGHFMINMKVDRNGTPEPLLFALSDPKYTGINRNDYWQIPIKFTDYVVKLDVNFYPPIGGYPAVITEEKQDEFYCKFSTQGVFELLPSVYNNATSTYLVYPEYDYEITSVTDATPSIFTVMPHKDSVTGEILAELNTNTGTACVNVKVTVDLGGGVSQIYERRVYIIHE